MSTIIITVDTKEPDRLYASTVRAMRRGLGVSAAELATAAGIPLPRLEAIEAGAPRHETNATPSRMRSVGCQTTVLPGP